MHQITDSPSVYSAVLVTLVYKILLEALSYSISLILWINIHSHTISQVCDLSPTAVQHTHRYIFDNTSEVHQ